MSAGEYTLVVEQGATLSKSIQVSNADGSDYDLTGATITGQIRKRYDSREKVVDLTCTLSGTPTDGTFTISLTASQTASIEVNNSDGPAKRSTLYAYDVLMTTSLGNKVRLLEGVCEVSPAVTR